MNNVKLRARPRVFSLQSLREYRMRYSIVMKTNNNETNTDTIKYKFNKTVGVSGMLGEVTMVQLYGVALTAGKAHRDHKHHHAHHFEHDKSNNRSPLIMTEATEARQPLPSPFLTGGQLNHQVMFHYYVLHSRNNFRA